jgi:ferredoxin
VAVDAVAQAIIGLDPLRVWTTYHAHTRGLGVGDLREIEILGEGLEAVRVKDFRLPPAAGEMVGRVPSSLTRWATRHLQAQPVVVRSRCVACGACVRACPTGAAQFRGKKAWIDKKKCIRCMCCHEACRYNAVELKLDILGRFFHAAERWVYRDRR